MRTVAALYTCLRGRSGVAEVHDALLKRKGDSIAYISHLEIAKVRQRLKGLDRIVIGLDGMKPEKPNACLYIVVREIQLGLMLIERYLRWIKMGQRRISGRKNVHRFIIRYGRYVTCVDHQESLDKLLVCLQ